MTIGKRVLYKGRVQGVGFRYTAERLAQGFEVAGHVRNLADGSVEIIAEGAPEEVDRFLNRVAGAMRQNIQDVTVTEQETSGVQGFRVRF
jgi:acylphosphatase